MTGDTERDIEILLHGMKPCEGGSTFADADEATSWSVLVREYDEDGDVEVLHDEDFATYDEAQTRAQALLLQYPGADLEELE